MKSSVMLVFSAYLAQAAGAVLLSIVFLVLYRFYRRRYLKDWAWSFWAASLAYSGGGVVLAIMRELSPASPIRVAVSYGALVAGYLQLVWLLAGAYGSTGIRQPRRKTVRTALWAVPAAAVLLGIFFSLTIKMPEVPLLVRLAFSGAAHFLAAWWVIGGWREERFLGRALVASSLGLLGLINLHNASTHLIVSLLHVQPDYLTYVPYLSILVQYLLGLGVVMWLLETERARAFKTSQQVERLAFYDALTGLPNRDLLLLRLAHALGQAKQSGARPALVCLELDRFKTIVDSQGYAVGDALLVAVAQRLRSLSGPGDTLARLNGDEFALLLPDNRTAEEAKASAEKLAEGFGTPFSLLGLDQNVTASMGVCLYPDGGPDAQALLKGAGIALNGAIEQGGGGVELYTPALRLKASERMSLEASLRRAMAQGEFVLFYQPILRTDSGALAAAEALLRWRHPDRGVVGPAEFLPALEAYGLADALDHWVLRTSCTDARRWKELLGRPVVVAVNLSARPFQSPGLVARVSHILDETHLDPTSLEIEITETIAMQDPQASSQVLLALKRLGVLLAIDDFGTGYSSLGTLHSLPVDTLKMDRSFVQSMDVDPRSAAIADSIILLAHGLGLKVVAEGVETGRQRTAVIRQGCDLMQGFLLSYPLPQEQFERYLLDHHAAKDGIKAS